MSTNKIKGEKGTTISLIPAENDDNFYSIHQSNSPSNRKLSSLLKRSYDFNKINLFEEQNKIGENSINFRKMELPKLNLKLNREYKLPSLITRIPHSGFKKEKLYRNKKINSKNQYLTINNVVLDEKNSFKQKPKNDFISMKRFIKLSKKNIINRNVINNKYEKDLNEFKIYSHNMNEMIADQIVIEFFKRFSKLQSINFNDNLLNFIKSCDGKNNMIDENVSTTNNNINVESDEKTKDEANEHNLIIHNVFFEWIINKAIRTYTNYLKSNKKDLSTGKIKNILINEVKNLSKLFFHKKFEKINMIRNIDFIDSKIDGIDNSNDDLNLENSLEIKKLRIKNELIDNIINKVSNNNNNSSFISNRNNFNNYPKSVTINNKRNRDIKINLKKSSNFTKDIRIMMDNTPDLLIKNETENNKENDTQLIKYQQNFDKLPLNIRKSISKNQKDINQKISEKINTDSNLIEKYRNFNGAQNFLEEENNAPEKRLYEQYYKFEGIDQLSDEIDVKNMKNRNSRKFSKFIENNTKINTSEILKYENAKRNSIKYIEKNNSNNINDNNYYIRAKTESNNNYEFNELKNQNIKDKILLGKIKENKNQMNKNNEIIYEENGKINRIKKYKRNSNNIDMKIKSENIENNIQNIKKLIKRKSNDFTNNKKNKKVTNRKLNEDININEENNILGNEKDYNEEKKEKNEKRNKKIKKVHKKNKTKSKKKKKINKDDGEFADDEREDEVEEEEDEGEAEEEEEEEKEEEGEVEEEEEEEEEGKEDEDDDNESNQLNKKKIRKKKIKKNSKKKKKINKSKDNLNNYQNENKNNQEINNKKKKRKGKVNGKNKNQNEENKDINNENDSIYKDEDMKEIEENPENENKNEENLNEQTNTISQDHENSEVKNITQELTNDKLNENEEIDNQIESKNEEDNNKETERVGEKEGDEKFGNEENINKINQSQTKKKKKIKKKKKKKDANKNNNDNKNANNSNQNDINNENLTKEKGNENTISEEEEEEEEKVEEIEHKDNTKRENKRANTNRRSSYIDKKIQNDRKKSQDIRRNSMIINKIKVAKTDKNKSTRKNAKRKTLVYEHLPKEKPKRRLTRSYTRKEVLDILKETTISAAQKEIELIQEQNYSNESFEEIIQKNKKRIKHKKAKNKVILPKLNDTSRGAFEQFKREQEMLKKKKEEEDNNEREKLKKYFRELKNIKRLDDEGFDNYIKGKFDTLKNIKDNNDIKLRKESFIYNFFKDLENCKNRKQKFSFISPIYFKNY